MKKRHFLQSIKDVRKLAKELEKLYDVICSASYEIIKSLKNNHKLIICGNGGSAADAQHMAAEFVNRFLKERKPLPAISLTTDTSIITSISNDYSFDDIFSKQIEALGHKGDILIGISTSGNSKNVENAIEAAKQKNIFCIGLLGKDGGKINSLCDLSIVIPSNSTPRIQEMHILIIHTICQIVEDEMI